MRNVTYQLVRLNKDINNPRSDKRYRDSFASALEWKKGTLLLLREERVFLDQSKKDLYRSLFLATHPRLSGTVGVGEEGPITFDDFDVIEPSTIRELMLLHRAHDYSNVAADILQKLVERGTVKLAEVEWFVQDECTNLWNDEERE